MNYNTLILDYMDEVSAGTQDPQVLCKTAGIKSLDSPGDISRLDDDDFALVILKKGEKFRKLPLSSRSNTELNKAAFLRNKHKLTMDASDIAESRIKAACARYRISDEGLSKRSGIVMSPLFLHTHLTSQEYDMRSTQAGLEKEASMVKFAINGTRHGHPIQKFRISTPEEVKKASVDIGTKLPVRWFIKGAKALLKQAEALDVKIDPMQEVNIIKNAQLSTAFEGEIHKRVRLSGGEGALQYMELLKTAQEGDLDSVAMALESLDFAHGFRYKWGSSLRNPALATYGLPKQAEMIEMERRDIEAGELCEFVETHREEVESAIGRAATQGLIDNPVLSFKALPAPHRQFLSELLSETA